MSNISSSGMAAGRSKAVEAAIDASKSLIKESDFDDFPQVNVIQLIKLIKEVSAKEVEYPRYGEMFGELIIDDCGIDASLFMGDGDIALRNGVGIYYGSLVPGYGGTIMVAGHNNTYFNGLRNAKKGQIVKIKTSYGNYTYKIIDIAVKNATDHTAYDLTSKTENLVMYTCYPFDELGLTPKRCFVYAKFVSGPVIINKGGDDN